MRVGSERSFAANGNSAVQIDWPRSPAKSIGRHPIGTAPDCRYDAPVA